MNNAETFQLTTPTDLEIVMTRVFDAPRKLVFEAWTTPKYLPQWMLGPEGWTMPVCEIDLRTGGAWRFAWRNSDGKEMGMSGVYKEVLPPERIVSTESWGGYGPETINTLVLTEKDGKTTITNTKLFPTKESRDMALKSGMKEGVDASFKRLEEFLSTLA